MKPLRKKQYGHKRTADRSFCIWTSEMKKPWCIFLDEDDQILFWFAILFSHVLNHQFRNCSTFDSVDTLILINQCMTDCFFWTMWSKYTDEQQNFWSYKKAQQRLAILPSGIQQFDIKWIKAKDCLLTGVKSLSHTLKNSSDIKCAVWLRQGASLN